MISAPSLASYDAARHRIGLAERQDYGRIVVSGKDRASYLQGLLTNDIVALKPGEGCYAAYLTPQGRMIADLWVYELGDVILLTLPRERKDIVLARLDQVIFAEDVQLGDVSDSFGALVALGPLAGDAVASVLDLDPARLAYLPEHGNLRATLAGRPVVVLQTSSLGQPGFDVLIEVAALDALRDALHRAGAVDLDEDTIERIRVEFGVPRFHRDMDEDTIPLEAGIESRAISFTKGCYVGQEVIIRVLHRGHGRVARKLVGLVMDDGPVPARGAVVSTGGREVGAVTSATWSPSKERPVAMAYLQRDFIEPGTHVRVDGHHAVVHTLPFAQ
jgi:folate-binding protein YgfZ